VTASLTTRLLHGTLVALPGDSSLGPHGAAFLASGLAVLTSAIVTSRVIGAKFPARQIVAFCSAFAFSLGLRLSNLTDARRVLGFLLTPAHNAFDPSLVYLAIGAVPLASMLYRVGSVRVQRKGKVDAQLLTGAAVFGIGWGIEGICRKSPSPVPDLATNLDYCMLIITGPCSWSRVGKPRLGTRDWRQHQAARDMASCRYHWRLLCAVMTVPLHLSLILLQHRSCTNFFYHYCISQHAGTTQGM
jgi:hypothetical protein